MTNVQIKSNTMTEYDPTVCPFCEWWVPEGMEHAMGDHIQQCIKDKWPPEPTFDG